MKKSLLALTVVGALSLGAAQAETVLYGSIRYDYQNGKNEFANGKGGKRTSNMTDQSSRIGLKGGEDLGNGVQVVYHLEWGFDGMEGGNNGDGFKNRLAYIGLATEFGTFVAGRLDNPFKGTIVDGTVTDDFNTFGESAAMRAVTSQFQGGVSVAWGSINVDNQWVDTNWSTFGVLGDYDKHGYGLDRVSNAIAYLSPNWNGFSFNAAMIMDDDLGIYQNKKHVDVFTINAMYEHESGFYGKVGFIQGYTMGGLVGSAFHNINNPDGSLAFSNANSTTANRKTRAFAAQLGYRTDQFGVSASYADAKLSDVTYGTNTVIGGISSGTALVKRKDKASGWDIGASYSFGDNYASTVRIAYGETRYKSEDSAWGTSDGTSAGTAYSYHTNIKPKDKIWSVGFEQKLSERTRVWAEYQNFKQSGSATRSSYDSANARVNHSRGFNTKKDTFAIGIRHDF